MKKGLIQSNLSKDNLKGTTNQATFKNLNINKSKKHNENNGQNWITLI